MLRNSSNEICDKGIDFYIELWYNCNILWHKSRPTRAVGVSVCRKTPAGYNHHYYDMKKVLHTVIAAALLLSAIFLVSCGENDELSRQAMEYLENKYENRNYFQK